MLLRIVLPLCIILTSGEDAFCQIGAPIIAVPQSFCGVISLLDESEPDTILYDDNGPSFSIGSISNYYGYVRFTPPADFQLRSIYLSIADSVGSSAPCSLWVQLPNGQRPGEELAASAIELHVGVGWYDITLSEGINFTAGQEFMIVVGRSPGISGWSPMLDGGSTGNRSYVIMGNRTTGLYQPIPYDFRIRAGGSFQSFEDLALAECFNQVNSAEPAFHLQPGDSIRLKARVQNTGASVIPSAIVQWMVYDHFWNPVFSQAAGIWDIESETEIIAEGPNVFVPSESGEYLCICRVTADADADSTNDVAYLRMFAVQNEDWFRYDDSEGDGAVVHGMNWMIGVSFYPSASPALVESVRVFCAMSGQASVALFPNNDDGTPGSSALWTCSESFEVGWTTIAVNPPLDLSDGEAFTAAFVFNGSMALGCDYDPPNASAMPNMGQIAWLRGTSEWQADHSGNWTIQAFVRNFESASPDLSTAPVKNFFLAQNYPNPFNAVTTIAYEVPRAGFISLRVFDLSGRVAAVLTDGFVDAGSYRIPFDGRNAASGVYFARLDAGAVSQTRKLVLLK